MTELKIMEDYIAGKDVPAYEPISFTVPEYSEWRMWFAPNCYWHPPKDGEPNWFHRKMQQLAFGVKWEKVP